MAIRSRKDRHPITTSNHDEACKRVRVSRKQKRADRPKISIREALVVLKKMEKGSGTISSLKEAAHVSRATVYRLLADCEEELGIRFNCESGTYSVKDWGLLSRRRVLG